jgi:hypothetical protein
MSGRKPLGPELVHHLEGSAHAKERWEVILEQVAGRLSVAQACERLVISEAMFHRIRNEALQAGLHRLEPRPIGRPPQKPSAEMQRVAELEQQLQDMNQQLQAAEVRREIAEILRCPSGDQAEKKTTDKKHRHRDLQRRLQSRKKKTR